MERSETPEEKIARLEQENTLLKETEKKQAATIAKVEASNQDLLRRNIRLEGEREAYGDVLEKLQEKLISEVRNR